MIRRRSIHLLPAYFNAAALVSPDRKAAETLKSLGDAALIVSYRTR